MKIVVVLITSLQIWPSSICMAFVPHRLMQQQQHLSYNRNQENDNFRFYISNSGLIVRSTRSRSYIVQRFAALDDDDDDEDDDDDDVDDERIDIVEPLAAGIDSVSWLPSVKDALTSSSTTTTSSVSKTEHPGAELIPLFPLGGIVYTPNSQHTLNIFEPRYREMYTDILMNGTKRFAVAMSHPTESGKFAQMAVLFELEDLKEVSERTADQIKYICNHRVTGRVKLHRVLNPQDWETRKTYLRAEGTVIDDSGKDVVSSIESSSKSPIIVNDIENPVEQRLLRDAFAKLVELQHELEEDVRFTRASVLTLAVKPGSKTDGLWQTIKLWQSFADQRLMSRQNELQQDFQEKLQNYLKKEKGLKGELPR
jgi:Lon protease-like protein